METIIMEFDKRFSLIKRESGGYEVYFNFNGENREIGYVGYPTKENILGNSINDYTEVIRRWGITGKWGGARSGAGRKGKGDEKLLSFACRLSKADIEKIRDIAEKKNISCGRVISSLLKKKNI